MKSLLVEHKSKERHLPHLPLLTKGPLVSEVLEHRYPLSRLGNEREECEKNVGGKYHVI